MDIETCKTDSYMKRVVMLFAPDVLFMEEEELTADSNEYVSSFILSNVNMTQDEVGFQHVVF